MAKRKYVITTGKGISTILKRGSHRTIKTAMQRAKKLVNQGNKDVMIQSFKKGGVLSFERKVK